LHFSYIFIEVGVSRYRISPQKNRRENLNVVKIGEMKAIVYLTH